MLIERKIDRISRFIEPLTDAQIDIILGYTESGSSTAMRWFKNRECRQNAMVAFLRTQPEKTEITAFVSRIILRAQEVVDPDPRAISAARWAQRETMYHDILTALNDEQRTELITTLRGYAAEMVELAGDLIARTPTPLSMSGWCGSGARPEKSDVDERCRSLAIAGCRAIGSNSHFGAAR